jgi:4-oxalomesaconate tautomerase
MWMRGGTSKGGYFLAEDLPADIAERDAFLLSAMGSPDVRQIDGMGGANPLTSKVAVVRRSTRPGIDIDYLFLQVFVDRPIVTDRQNCGNMLAGAGRFAGACSAWLAIGVGDDGSRSPPLRGKCPAGQRGVRRGVVSFRGVAALDGHNG